jgi:hypothetical protein
MKECESLKTLSALALLFCLVVACRQSGSSSDNSKTIKSADGKFQITIPDDWTTKSLNPNEQIRTLTKTGESVVILTSVPKAEAANDMTLDKFADNLRNLSISKNGATDVSGIESITINGSDARQFEHKKTTDNIGVVCLVTAVETPEHFHQISACILARMYDEKKATVKQVINSFRAVPASNSDANPTSSP